MSVSFQGSLAAGWPCALPEAAAIRKGRMGNATASKPADKPTNFASSHALRKTRVPSWKSQSLLRLMHGILVTQRGENQLGRGGRRSNGTDILPQGTVLDGL